MCLPLEHTFVCARKMHMLRIACMILYAHVRACVCIGAMRTCAEHQQVFRCAADCCQHACPTMSSGEFVRRFSLYAFAHKGVGPSPHMCVPSERTCGCPWNTKMLARTHTHTCDIASHLQTLTSTYPFAHVYADATYSCALSTSSKRSVAQRIDIYMRVLRGAVAFFNMRSNGL